MQSKLPLQEFVINLLNLKLPDYYYYHDYEHTLYVLENVNVICDHEGCTTEDRHLLSTAALWHDTGYIVKYLGHEEESCNLARKYLPDYGFNEHDIATICGMIMATQVPQMPKTKLEEIIADADLEYLGAPHPEIKADKLYRELCNVYPTLSAERWTQTQVSFIESHSYFTNYCKTHSESAKQRYLQSLKGRF